MTRDGAQDLYRLLYRSRSALTGSEEAVEAAIAAILETSRRNNARDGVTGALIFTSSMFIQALEGPRETVEAAFERICCDLRHLEVEIIEYAAAAERAFGAWSLHRVRADHAVEALFLQLNHGGSVDVDVSSASARAVELMCTLIDLEAATTTGDLSGLAA